MRRASEHDSSLPAKKQKSIQVELFDIAGIKSLRGDVEFYRDRFFAWRRANGRDDPTQTLVDKTNSWRTFVRLENERKIDFLLRKARLSARRGSEIHRASDRCSSDCTEATNCSRTHERHRGHQPQGFHDAPTCLRSADTPAIAHGISDSIASSGASTVSDHPDDPRSNPPTNGDFHDSLSPEVGLNAKTIERLWRWKSAHRSQIAELSQHCSDLTTRCESLEARCGALENDFDFVRAPTSQTSSQKPDFESSLQAIDSDLRDLQKREKARDLNHSRVLSAVEDAGSLIGSLRSEFEARLVALESVKEQSFDVLQRLYAESQLQTTELARLREQVDGLQQTVDRRCRRQ